MILTVKLFAAARDMAGTPSIDVELPENATVADLRQTLLDRLPKGRELLSRSLFAMDFAYVTEQTKLRPGVDLACIPPVSGG
jgi:molybdopterin converting factor small subunit